MHAAGRRHDADPSGFRFLGIFEVSVSLMERAREPDLADARPRCSCVSQRSWRYRRRASLAWTTMLPLGIAYSGVIKNLRLRGEYMRMTKAPPPCSGRASSDCRRAIVLTDSSGPSRLTRSNSCRVQRHRAVLRIRFFWRNRSLSGEKSATAPSIASIFSFR